jgi:hypothetical protein
MRSLLLVFAVLAACGDDDNRPLADAPVFDDAPVDMPTNGPVKITITSRGEPQVGIRVHFQNADSTLVITAATDATGSAVATMEPGGFVTVIDPFPRIGGVALPSEAVTYAGVKPGDELVLIDNQRGGASTQVDFELLIGLEPTDTATQYLLFTPCTQFGLDVTNAAGATAGNGAQVSLFGCTATTDFTIVANDVNGQIVKAWHKANVTPAQAATLDLSAEAYVDPETVSFDYQSIPGGFTLVTANAQVASQNGVTFASGGSADVVNTTASIRGVVRPVIAGTQVTLSQLFNGSSSVHSVLEWGVPTTAYMLSLGNILTPTILLPQYTGAPTWDFTLGGLTWTTDNVGRQPDLVRALVHFQRTDAANVTTFWEWDIAAPLGATNQLAFPTLPAPDDILTPQMTDDFQIADVLTTAKVPNGYDAVRENILSLNPFGEPAGFVVGPSGQAVIEELQLAAVRKRGWKKLWQPIATLLRR